MTSLFTVILLGQRMEDGGRAGAVVVAAAGIAALPARSPPFIEFRKHTPDYVRHLGKPLPAAVFGLLVVYCLRDASLISGTHGVPEAIGAAVTVGLYARRRDMFIAIFGSAAVHMALANLVFA